MPHIPDLPTLLWSGTIVLSSQLIFFGMGWVYFMSKLYKDYEVRNNLVRLMFVVTFAMCCTLFELIIFEIAYILDRK